ncbi:MAG: hypothetical protein WA635_02505, partial [Gallionella sp.]
MSSAKNHEYRRAATRAGLRYVTDGFAGISRSRSGKGWSYYQPDGSLIKGTAERKRLNALAVPPAWTNVWICPDPAGPDDDPELPAAIAALARETGYPILADPLSG